MIHMALHWLQLIQHELLLFAVCCFVLSAIDEFAIDLVWVWLRLTGRGRYPRVPSRLVQEPLTGLTAVFIPTWREEAVIGTTIAHALAAWPQQELRLYVGCYGNDPETIAAAMAAAGNDSRIRVIINARHGPTTKADCLNRLYQALCDDEARSGVQARNVILHDAEDMVHPLELFVIDRALEHADFVQLPVRPELQTESRWVSAHYADEFAEAHGKAMVVRDAVRAALPAAGVGCGVSRARLAELVQMRRKMGEAGPFAADSLTEDYELGIWASRSGRGGRFVRLRDEDGQLIATRSCFPANLTEAVRQKARWTHGISLQGWDRIGWIGRPVDFWMMLRDRRGPMSALVTAVAYLLLLLEILLFCASKAGWITAASMGSELTLMLKISLVAFIWRSLCRCGFTAAEYGLTEGLRAVARIPVANVIAIWAGHRALLAYWRSLRGGEVIWEKTVHDAHPAQMIASRAVS